MFSRTVTEIPMMRKPDRCGRAASIGITALPGSAPDITNLMQAVSEKVSVDRLQNIYKKERYVI